eukprot:m.30154 g.30154  ORF g.30154 m.30154 type:complete len:584 (+) comp9253_c0_seq2:197-1948(+)
MAVSYFAVVTAVCLALTCVLCVHVDAMSQCTARTVAEFKLYARNGYCQAYNLGSARLDDMTLEDKEEIHKGLMASKGPLSLNAFRVKLNEHSFNLIVEVLNQGLDVQAVDLSHNKLTSEQFSQLLSAVARSPTLEALSFMNCGMQDAAAVELASTLVAHASLGEGSGITRLNLFHNQLSAAGASAIAASLSKTCSIQALDMSMNPLGDSGVAALSTILMACPSLTTLSISGTQTTLNGARAIAGVLSSSQLQHLSFAKNYELGVSGGRAFGKALADNGTRALTFVDMSMCSLEDAGVKSLLTRLTATSSSITNLLLAVNSLTPDVAPTILEFIQSHHALEVLDIGYNDLGETFCESLVDLLKAITVYRPFRRIALRKTGAAQTCLDQVALELLRIQDIAKSTDEGGEGQCSSTDTDCGKEETGEAGSKYTETAQRVGTDADKQSGSSVQGNNVGLGVNVESNNDDSSSSSHRERPIIRTQAQIDHCLESTGSATCNAPVRRRPATVDIGSIEGRVIALFATHHLIEDMSLLSKSSLTTMDQLTSLCCDVDDVMTCIPQALLDYITRDSVNTNRWKRLVAQACL